MLITWCRATSRAFAYALADAQALPSPAPVRYAL